MLESGTHDKLLAINGAYSRLVHAQKLREGNTEQYSTEGSEAGGDEHVDMEKAAREEIPLGRRSTRQSLASEILEQRRKAEGARKKDDDFGFTYIFMRMANLVRDQWKNYLLGSLFAISEFYDVALLFHVAQCPFPVSGMVYPAYGLIFAKGIDGFAKVDPRERRHDGDRNALWLFIVAILATLCIGFQNYLFGYASSVLTARLRTVSFKALLRQDIEFFDQDKNNVSESLFVLRLYFHELMCRQDH